MERSVQESLFQPLPTVEELRQALKGSEGSEIRQQLAYLFDDQTFVELGVYAKRSFSEYATTGRTNEFEGVICGYGAISGTLVYVFAQDISRMKGAIDANHAKKIASLYELAMQNGAPVIGIFNSAGADIYEGVSALSAYGSMMKSVAKASGVIPQIALVNGLCTGTTAAVAAMFDFIVMTEGSSFYINLPEFGGNGECNDGLCAYRVPDAMSGMDAIRNILYYLPSNASEGVMPETSSDDMNRLLGELEFDNDPHIALSAIADHGNYIELYRDYSEEATVALATVGGVRCGILAVMSQSGGRLSSYAARKGARFVSFLDAFSIPLVTLVDSTGFAPCSDGASLPFAAELARLASAYAQSSMPKVSVILKHAIGGPFAILGSKAIGADIAYALDDAEIGALSAQASVAFVWNNQITPEIPRKSLEEEWLRTLSSPVAAASHGEIDDIITVDELRARICTSLHMLCAKGSIRRRHPVLPL